MTQTEAYMRAISNPNGISNEAHPDGTPKTNMEFYLSHYDEKIARSRDFH